MLVVDDEELLVSLTSEALQRFGYEPVGFTDSRAALAAFESGPERFDAAVTDELMPGITGTELVALLHRRRADLPIVLVSGYIGAPLADKARGAGVTEILKKPVQSREIAEVATRVGLLFQAQRRVRRYGQVALLDGHCPVGSTTCWLFQLS